jgi:hypothetical protein
MYSNDDYPLTFQRGLLDFCHPNPLQLIKNSKSTLESQLCSFYREKEQKIEAITELPVTDCDVRRRRVPLHGRRVQPVAHGARGDVGRDGEDHQGQQQEAKIKNVIQTRSKT